MILLIIAFVIFVLISTAIIRERNNQNKVANIIGTFCGIALIYGFLIGILHVLLIDDKYTTTEYKDLNIQSLVNKSGSELNGSFVLGFGSISGKDRDYYVAYSEFPQGLLRVKVDAENTYIKESSTDTPKIINYYMRRNWNGYKSKWIWDSKPRMGAWVVNEYGEKIVVVPEKTVYKDVFKIED